MNIAKIIEQFGYKPNEAKVYLATLSVVEATASKIATKAKLPLSSTQVALGKLHKDGLMNFYVRKSHKYWVAEPLEKLMQICKTREEKFSSALKNMKLLNKENSGKPEVKVFLGPDEIKLIHDNMIQKKHPISAIIPWEPWALLLGEDYLNDFINFRIRHQLYMRMLVPKTPATQKLKKMDSQELRHTKFLPSNVLIEDALFIFGKNVAIITLNEQQPTGVVIRDGATTRMLGTFLEDLWEKSTNE